MDRIAPDVGVGEEVAHYYFAQLVDGMVRFWTHTDDDTC